MNSLLNKPELICLHTDKWFQVLLCNTDNSIQQSFYFIELIGITGRSLNVASNRL